MEEAAAGAGRGRLRHGRRAGKELSAEELKALHTKSGQQALEIDFLSGALGRISEPSVKR